MGLRRRTPVTQGGVRRGRSGGRGTLLYEGERQILDVKEREDTEPRTPKSCRTENTFTEQEEDEEFSNSYKPE